MTDNRLDRSSTFDQKLKGFGKQERKAIFTHFVTTFTEDGFSGLNNYYLDGYLVRNKNSDNVDTDCPDFIEQVKYAQKHSLWHFHAGFYDYSYEIKGYELSQKGDLTSQWVIHYQYFNDNHIKVVDVTPHPPFELPTEDKLT
jgi:hypothetical protein